MTKIVDFVSGSPDMDFLEKFYDTTLSALKDSQNERLWFKTNMKLAKLWFDKHEFHRLQRILRELHKSCTTDGGQDDQKKGTQLLELYSLDIQVGQHLRTCHMLSCVISGCMSCQYKPLISSDTQSHNVRNLQRADAHGQEG